eukprot:scaffold9323_cov74-Skeletonema_dohrnii-CCMP3373.AAC.1
MFDLSNYFASASHVRTAMTSSKSSSSSDETASTSSVSSDSAPTSSSRNDGAYNNRQAKHIYKDRPSNASNDDDINDEEQEVVHIPPKIAFQIFELIELKRRCKGLYRRHQEKRRQSVIKANNASYHSVTSAFESYCVDGELFV